MPYLREKRVLKDAGIGKALRDARLARGFSQEYLATCVGMSASSISHIEAGADLKTSTLLRLASECRLEVYVVPKAAAHIVSALLRDLELGGS